MILDTTVLIDLQKELRREQHLWIAALALQHGRMVVSRNEQHFRRVPGLSFRAH